MSRQRIEIEVRHMDRLIKELKNISSKLDKIKQEPDRETVEQLKSFEEILQWMHNICKSRESFADCEGCYLGEICTKAGDSFKPSAWKL